MSIYKKSPQQQSTQEWLNDYCGKRNESPAEVIPLSNTNNPLKVGCFRYVTHRTTKTKSVALSFQSLDGDIQATRFFNVGLKSSRGNNYPAKSNGQFIPPKHGSFVKFWLKVVGYAPERWCRVHKSLRSHLTKFVFECSYELAISKSGEEYWRIKEILGTK